jgi:hypothetical protein
MAWFTSWTVLPHEPIRKESENLWWVEGTMPDGKTKRKMTVVRLRDGSLVIHNAIALSDAEMQELEAFGKPAYIVVPGAHHRQDARIWKDRYPAAKIVAPAGVKKRVEQVVPVDLDYRDAPQDDAVKFAYFDGCKEKEGYLEVRAADGTTLVVNDVVFNMPKLGGPIGFLLGPTGQPSLPRAIRWLVVSNRAALREQVERLAATPNLKRVVLSHGTNLESDAGAALRVAHATM